MTPEEQLLEVRRDEHIPSPPPLCFGSTHVPVEPALASRASLCYVDQREPSTARAEPCLRFPFNFPLVPRGLCTQRASRGGC